MKSRKMFNRVSALALAGLMVAAPSASLYAKTPVKVTVKKWCSQKPSCGTNTGTGNSNGTTGGNSNTGGGSSNKPGSSNNGQTNTETTTQKAFEDKVLELVNAQI